MEDTAITLIKVRKRAIWQMETTCATLGHILQNLIKSQAYDLRDGADGWSVVEIVCHMRDFDVIFYNRAKMMLEQDHPQLPGYDHEAMAIDNNYQAEDLMTAYEALKASRAQFVELFRSMTDEQWQRTGVHPERDSFTMIDSVQQVGLHDVTHIEQITRVLTQA